jgi:FkbM family methyltransferase
MKKIIQKLVNLFGYKVMKIELTDYTDLDGSTKSLITKLEPVIFDVGAHNGNSVKRYKKLFDKPIIHCFEPISDDLNTIKNNYPNDHKLFLNNVGVGDKRGYLKFNINTKRNTSSFKNLIPNTTWIKKSSKRFNVNDKKFTIKEQNTKIITLDDYVNEKNISYIDILKIDTQGFEDKVILGAQNLLKNNRIKLIQLELIFSEIYEEPLQIYDIEKILIPNNYKLFCISNAGSLNSNYIYQSDFIYISNDTYENFKSSSPYLNN